MTHSTISHSRADGIGEARLSTGANIVSGAGYDAIAEEMVDMESYACLRACMRFTVPPAAVDRLADALAEGLLGVER